MILGLISPESPTWLVTKGRFSEAREAFKWLNNSDENVDSEIQTLSQSFKQKKVSSSTNGSMIIQILKLFRRTDVLKPLFLMMALMLLQQFCGISTIAYYAVNVLVASHSGVDAVSSKI